MLKDLRRGPEFYRYLLRLVIPVTLQNLIAFSLGLIDTFMVSQLGNEEMAAVTAANVPAFFIQSIIYGLQSGVGILISQYWGKHYKRSISRALGVAVYVGTGIALVFALVFFLWPIQVMDLLSNSHDLSLLGAPYLRFIGIAYVFNMISSIYVSAHRSVENPAFGMKLFGVSTAVNTFLNYLLIYGKFGFPRWGVMGAAVATMTARFLEFVICAVCALRSKKLAMDWKAFLAPGLDMVRRFLKYSTPVVANETAWGLGTSLFTVIYGYTANSVQMLAANSVMGNIRNLSMVLCFGLGAATAVVVGKAVGEGRSREEVMSLSRALLQFTLLVATGLTVLAMALLPTLFQPVIFPLFKLFDESARIATAMAVTIFLTIPTHAYTITALTGVLRGGGDVRWSTVLDLAPLWGVAIPLTALVALVLQWNYWWITIAIQSETLLKMPLAWLRVRSGKWIHDVTANVRKKKQP